jgi:hypothetical protein
VNKQWVAFHLQEALDQLQQTLNELTEPDYDETNLRFDMQHAYNHINTAWNSRNESDERTASCVEDDFYRWRNFPTDIYMGP